METKSILFILILFLFAYAANAQPQSYPNQRPNTQLPSHQKLLPSLLYSRQELKAMFEKKPTGANIAAVQSSNVNPAIQWQKCLGGSSDDLTGFGQYIWSAPGNIQSTCDGGYIVAGTSNSNDGNVHDNHGGYDYWIVKLSRAGTIQWQKSLGGTEDDLGQSIQQTKDGGYIVAGVSTSNDGDVTAHHGATGGLFVNGDYWIVKLSSTGAIQWEKSLGGTNDEGAGTIQQTKDGGYIVAGYSTSNDDDVSGNHGSYDYWIVKLNKAGAIQWQKSLGGTLEEVAFSIQQTDDNGYIVAGLTGSNDGDVKGNHGFWNYWIVKLNETGTIKWQKCFGGTNSFDNATSIQQTKDGGYIVAGSASSNDGDITGHHGEAGIPDYWIIKLNSTGTLQWQKSLGGTNIDQANNIQQTKDGGYIVAGSSASNDGDVSGNHGNGEFLFGDCWIVKLDSKGKVLRESNLGGTSDEYATGIEQTRDGGYILAGTSFSNDGDVSDNHGGFGDFWIVKLKHFIDAPNPQNVITSTNNSAVIEKNTYEPLLHIQPNPSHNGAFTADIGAMKDNVVISVTDNTGREVYKTRFLSAQQFNIKLNNQPKGIYYLNIRYDGGKQTQKLVLE